MSAEEMAGQVPSVVRVAATADVHVDESRGAEVARALAGVEREADLLLIAGDLTTWGEPAQAAVLADACRGLEVPVVAILGNHDWHMNRQDEIVELLRSAGITVLDRSSTVLEVAGTRVGIVGTKGFVGGFETASLPDFGEPLLRRAFAETTAEVAAIERGLASVADCPVRVVLLHYAPTAATVQGERAEIWAFLGSDRLAEPILARPPHIVFHGHAHVGSPEGMIGQTPVYNVAVTVTRRHYRVFELTPDGRPAR